jgi:molybdopterin-biosynthesis enzyme MoeA-like protein
MDVHLFVIGDEILSGKRQDRHVRKVIELLGQRGMELAGVEFLPDDEHAIAPRIRAIAQAGNALLSCGGIGATPDDRTRQAAALAFGQALAPHPEALALIRAEYGERATSSRMLMAEFPAGAGLVPNPINRVAGFSVGDCYFVPGFPEMAWPMLEWVLDERLRRLHDSEPKVEYSLRAVGSSGEGDLLDLMNATLEAFPGVKLSSLPFRGDGTRPRHIEFGIKGPRAQAAAAFDWFRAHLSERPGLQIELLRGPAA